MIADKEKIISIVSTAVIKMLHYCCKMTKGGTLQNDFLLTCCLPKLQFVLPGNVLCLVYDVFSFDTIYKGKIFDKTNILDAVF
jgi:hypothetical protein